MRYTLSLALWVSLGSLPAVGKDLGTYGETFAITEQDLLKQIQSKLLRLEEEGAILHHQKLMADRARQAIERPMPLKHITRTQKSRVYIYDPSIQLEYDLKDHQGRVFYKAGTTVNPLTTITLSTVLMFIDGDDEEQQAWALQEDKRLQGKLKIILVNGAPLQLQREWQRPVYFDQSGSISTKFGIEHVPAIVSQKGDVLEIEEVVLSYKGTFAHEDSLHKAAVLTGEAFHETGR